MSKRLTVEALGGDDTIMASVTNAGPVIDAGRRAGEDSLSAGDSDITWTLTGETSGTAAAGAMVAFTSIEHLLGGQGKDTLVVVPPVTPGPGPQPPPEIEVMENMVKIKTPDPQNPDPPEIDIQNVEQIISTTVPTTVVVTAIPLLPSACSRAVRSSGLSLGED